MSADNCGYCGASLIYMDGTYVCPDCTLTLGEQREIRRYIRDNNTPHNELPVWLVSLIARAEAAENVINAAHAVLARQVAEPHTSRGDTNAMVEAITILETVTLKGGA